jgi:hypothetical protein
VKVEICDSVKKAMPQTYFDIGRRFIETLWFSYASRIIDKAITIYNLDEDRANSLREKFLKRGEYSVKLAE